MYDIETIRSLASFCRQATKAEFKKKENLEEQQRQKARELFK